MIREYNNYSLLSHNTFGIDVKTTRFIEYDTVDELRELLISGRITDPWLHIGSGSNLLFLADFDGVVFGGEVLRVVEVEGPVDGGGAA